MTSCAVCRHVPDRDCYRRTSDGHAWIHTFTGLALACSGDGERSPVGRPAWRAALTADLRKEDVGRVGA